MTTSENTPDRNDPSEDTPTGQLPADGATQELPVPDATAELPHAGTTTEAHRPDGTEATSATEPPAPGGTTDAAPLDWRTAEYGPDRSSSSSSDGARDRTDRATPPPVWTASSSVGTPADADATSGTSHRPEAPARGVRVGQLIWAGIVILLGVFLIALALLPNLDVATALIGLVALLGVALIIAAWATSRRPKG